MTRVPSARAKKIGRWIVASTVVVSSELLLQQAALPWAWRLVVESIVTGLVVVVILQSAGRVK